MLTPFQSHLPISPTPFKYPISISMSILLLISLSILFPLCKISDKSPSYWPDWWFIINNNNANHSNSPAGHSDYKHNHPHLQQLPQFLRCQHLQQLPHPCQPGSRQNHIRRHPISLTPSPNSNRNHKRWYIQHPRPVHLHLLPATLHPTRCSLLDLLLGCGLLQSLREEMPTLQILAQKLHKKSLLSLLAQNPHDICSYFWCGYCHMHNSCIFIFYHPQKRCGNGQMRSLLQHRRGYQWGTVPELGRFRPGTISTLLHFWISR